MTSKHYSEINSKALNLVLSAKKHTTSIGPDLAAMVELRVSQINGCAYCVDLHSSEARNAGVPQQKLDCLVVWNESDLFSEKESVALEWAECVTNISRESNMEDKRSKLSRVFSEGEIVDLTYIISLMNCLNRVSISFGDKPPQADEQQVT